MKKPLLTRKELEICDMYSNGMTSLQIAKQLFITEKTLRKHRSNIKCKFKANSSIELGYKMAKLFENKFYSHFFYKTTQK